MGHKVKKASVVMRRCAATKYALRHGSFDVRKQKHLLRTKGLRLVLAHHAVASRDARAFVRVWFMCFRVVHAHISRSRFLSPLRVVLPQDAHVTPDHDFRINLFTFLSGDVTSVL